MLCLSSNKYQITLLMICLNDDKRPDKTSVVNDLLAEVGGILSNVGCIVNFENFHILNTTLTRTKSVTKYSGS